MVTMERAVRESVSSKSCPVAASLLLNAALLVSHKHAEETQTSEEWLMTNLIAGAFDAKR